MENKQQTIKSDTIMTKQDFIENAKSVIFLFLFLIGFMIVISPLLLLMHDSGDGPDIYNLIGPAYLAILIFTPKIYKWWRNR